MYLISYLYHLNIMEMHLPWQRSWSQSPPIESHIGLPALGEVRFSLCTRPPSPSPPPPPGSCSRGSLFSLSPAKINNKLKKSLKKLKRNISHFNHLINTVFKVTGFIYTHIYYHWHHSREGTMKFSVATYLLSFLLSSLPSPLLHLAFFFFFAFLFL